MKAVVQRVSNAQVSVNNSIIGSIDKGLLVFLGIMEADTKKQADFLAKKICELRIFTDDNDKMNLSLKDIDGQILIISNFTLGADCKHGRRPYFVDSADPVIAKELYEYFIKCVIDEKINKVDTGEFGASMQVNLLNDGPVTIILDTKEMGK
ncbi:MAG: D-aminoacyl-tRNA deacylase [Oscillospiraceae bacterium]